MNKTVVLLAAVVLVLLAFPQKQPEADAPPEPARTLTIVPPEAPTAPKRTIIPPDAPEPEVEREPEISYISPEFRIREESETPDTLPRFRLAKGAVVPPDTPAITDAEREQFNLIPGWALERMWAELEETFWARVEEAAPMAAEYFMLDTELKYMARGVISADGRTEMVAASAKEIRRQFMGIWESARANPDQQMALRLIEVFLERLEPEVAAMRADIGRHDRAREPEVKREPDVLSELRPLEQANLVPDPDRKRRWTELEKNFWAEAEELLGVAEEYFEKFPGPRDILLGVIVDDDREPVGADSANEARRQCTVFWKQVEQLPDRLEAMQEAQRMTVHLQSEADAMRADIARHSDPEPLPERDRGEGRYHMLAPLDKGIPLSLEWTPLDKVNAPYENVRTMPNKLTANEWMSMWRATLREKGQNYWLEYFDGTGAADLQVYLEILVGIQTYLKANEESWTARDGLEMDQVSNLAFHILEKLAHE